MGQQIGCAGGYAGDKVEFGEFWKERVKERVKGEYFDKNSNF